MSEHRANITWVLETQSFAYKDYNREYSVRFEGGQAMRGSGAPEFLGKAEHVNPEEMLVASLSSCHMLTFLAVASKRGFIVERYEDDAVGFMEKNVKGKLAVTRATLKPKVSFRDKSPDAEQLARIHETSHKECFIANSVLTEITVEPVL